MKKKMFKFKKIFLVMLIVLINVVFINTLKAETLTSDTAYKAIVKIYTYYEDEDYNLTMLGSGSGVIINNNGVILTNNHVIFSEDDFKNEISTAYKICLTKNTTEKPDCSYSASLIIRDEEKDVALLKIENIESLSSQINFEYIERIKEKDYSEGDDVKAIGYPSYGGTTITTTTGTISGTTEKYNLSWVKTDASFSFGSSGGALINNIDGKLIGITTSAHSDFLGSLGYVIDITSINDWIDDNLNKDSKESSLNSKIKNLIKEQKNLESTDIFVNSLPNISINRESGWEFNYDSEGFLTIENSENSDGGTIALNWVNGAILLEGKLESVVKERELLNCISIEDVVIDEVKGKKIVQSIFGQEFYQIIIPSKNFLVIISYFYGDEDSDKEAIETMMESFTISNANNSFLEERSYQNSDPFFNITVPQEWGLKKKNLITQPVVGESYGDYPISFDVNIEKLSENTKKMSNEEYFNYKKNDELVKNNNEDILNLKSDLYFKSFDYKINNELNNEIFYKYRFKDEDEDDKVKTYAAGYMIMDDDKVIIIEFDYLGDDEELFEQNLENFKNNVLVNLTLGREIIVPQDDDEDFDDEDFDELETKSVTNDFSKKQIGKILLQVEKEGEAWYFSPKSNKAYYLGRPEDAFSIMREQGVGITNKDLEKIPVGLSNLGGIDTDKDGLPDMFEDVIGTDKNKKDTDGDGYDDKVELENGYSPKIKLQKQNLDNNFSNNQKGKIFLQVEGNGEAWYVNTTDNKRYFLGRPSDAFSVMRNMGIGISENDFKKI